MDSARQEGLVLGEQKDLKFTDPSQPFQGVILNQQAQQQGNEIIINNMQPVEYIGNPRKATLHPLGPTLSPLVQQFEHLSQVLQPSRDQALQGTWEKNSLVPDEYDVRAPFTHPTLDHSDMVKHQQQGSQAAPSIQQFPERYPNQDIGNVLASASYSGLSGVLHTPSTTKSGQVLSHRLVSLVRGDNVQYTGRVAIGEAKNSPSWNSSQAVNDALAAFQQASQNLAYSGPDPDDFLSVTGSQTSVQDISDSLASSERAELEYLRQLFAGMNLSEFQGVQGVGVRNVGHFWQGHQYGGPSVPTPQIVQQPSAVAIGEAASAHKQPTLVPKEIKLSKPSDFHGNKAQVDNFIFEMKQYVDTVGLGDGDTACRFIVSHLKGDALTWWRSYCRNSQHIFSQLTTDVLFDDLKTQFSDIDEEMKLRDKALTLRQKGSVTEYVTQFKQLQLKLGSHCLQDDVALHVFLVGLKTFTRQQVMLQRPDTLGEAILLAERAEQSLYWAQGSTGKRTFYPGTRENSQNVSQYSNSRYKGPAPMVLGTVQQQPGKSGKATVQCYHCGKTGHYKRECWQLHGKSQQGRKQGGSKKLHAMAATTTPPKDQSKN